MSIQRQYLPLFQIHCTDSSSGEPISNITLALANSALTTFSNKALLFKATDFGASLSYTRNLMSGNVLGKISSATRFMFLMLAEPSVMQKYQIDLGRDQKLHLTNIAANGDTLEQASNNLHTTSTVTSANARNRKTDPVLSSTLTDIELNQQRLIGLIDITLQQPQDLAPTQGYRFEAKFAPK
jgi:hypothetical protein